VDVQGMNPQASVSPRESARMLEIRIDAVYGLIWAGRLTAEKRDGRWLVSQSAVAERVSSKARRKVPYVALCAVDGVHREESSPHSSPEPVRNQEPSQ